MPMLFNPLLDKKPGSLGARLLFAIASQSGNRTHSGGGSGGGGGGAQVEDFGFEPETETLAASFSVAPTANRKRTINRAIKRLKAAGIWNKTTAMYFIGANENASLKNWKTPGTFDCTINGAATFTANDGWVWSGVAAQSLNTNMPCNTLQQNNHGHYSWTKTGVLASGARYGAINAGSTGISFTNRTATNDQLNGRAGGTALNVSAVNHSDGVGLCGISRHDSANIIGSKNGVRKSTVASTSAALPSINIHLLALNNNGTIGNGIALEKHAFWWFGQGLQEAEERELTGIVGEYLDYVLHGDIYIEEVGIGTAAITADCIGYSFNLDAINFCVQAVRAGKTAALAGDFRGRWSFGGMAGGGLGYTDFDSPDGLGGLARWLITRCNQLAGTSDVASGTNPAAYKFQPKYLKKAILELLAFYNIPLYQTDGVVSVEKTGTVISAFRTTDGRTFTGLQFYDGSYEKDLMRLAGVTYRKGREAAGSGVEASNGVEAIAGTARPLTHAAVAIDVDPWITPGVPASGLLPNIHYIASTFTPALHNYPAAGTADTGIPAYNFRLTMTSTAQNRVPLPTTPPPGFDALNYEIYIRWMANCVTAGSALTLSDIFKMDDLRTSGRHDLNKNGILSTNLTGENHDYPLATYAEREIIWKQVWNHIMGLWYVLQHHVDARIPAALRTEALSWGFCQDHYFAPHENDEIFHMPQMYVREAIRMESDVVMLGGHMTQTDGQVPTLGDHTISVASYDLDSHSVHNVAHEISAGVWTIRAEGGMLVSAGGVDKKSPLPYSIAVPKITDCTNLSIGFGLSTTHVSYGTTRMEFTAAQTGQSMGAAAALAIDGDNIIQNVDYATLRSVLLASPALSGEIAPVLPQLT